MAFAIKVSPFLDSDCHWDVVLFAQDRWKLDSILHSAVARVYSTG